MGVVQPVVQCKWLLCLTLVVDGARDISICLRVLALQKHLALDLSIDQEYESILLACPTNRLLYSTSERHWAASWGLILKL